MDLSTRLLLLKIEELGFETEPFLAEGLAGGRIYLRLNGKMTAGIILKGMLIYGKKDTHWFWGEDHKVVNGYVQFKTLENLIKILKAQKEKFDGSGHQDSVIKN